MEGRPKKLPAPFELRYLAQVLAETPSQPSPLARIADQPPESFEYDTETDGDLANELESLLEKSKEQLLVLKERAALLQDLIANQFGIENPERWLAEHSEAKPKPITLTLPTDVKTSKQTSGLSSVAPTTLRIKLVDSKPAGSVSSKNQRTLPAIGRGAGSKNLSRMNRPQDEAAKAKAANQIPINVFWNQVEAFFKPVEEGDMKFLCDPSRIIDPSPFIIPPLGRPFLEQWQQQYGYVSSAGQRGGVPAMAQAVDQFKPTLKDRLLSLLIDEGLPVGSPMETDVHNEEQATEVDLTEQFAPPARAEYTHLDERLRHELAATGFEEFANCTADYQEDDAICTELRNLQRQLQEQVAVNYYRKRKLSDITKAKLPAQEFYSLLSELDKQLEQVFLKRTKSSKKKKKTGPVAASNATGGETPGAAAPADAVRLLENRAKLLSAFAPYIPGLGDFLASEDAHLVDAKEEGHVVQIAQQTGSWLPLPSSTEPVFTEFTRPLPRSQPVFPK